MAEPAVTIIANRPFVLIDEIMDDFNLFIVEEGRAFSAFFTSHRLLEKEDLKTIFEGIAGVMRWLYDRLIDFGNLIIPFDCAFAMLEVIAGFFDGLIDMIENVPSHDPQSPLAAIYKLTDKIDILIPDNFSAQAIVEKLNFLPSTQEIHKLKLSILEIIGTGDISEEHIPGGVQIEGSIKNLINAL